MTFVGSISTHADIEYIKKKKKKKLSDLKEISTMNLMQKYQNYFNFLDSIAGKIRNVERKSFLDDSIINHLRKQFSELSYDEANEIVDLWRYDRFG